MLRVLIAALVLTGSTSAAAHSFWLQPRDHTLAAGEEVRVEFQIGDAGEAADWGVFWERIASFRLYGPDGVIDQLRSLRTTTAAEPGGAVVNLRSPGSYVLAFESNPSFSDLEATRFDAYVEHEGLKAIAAHRKVTGAGRRNGTEIYMRRAKTLLQVGDRPTPNATQLIGQILEIRPLQNPFALAQGEPLGLQVFWRGEPLEGALLSAAPLDTTGDVTSYTTSADGVATVQAPGDGAMLYSVVWGVPAPNDARADYITVFASLTVGGK